MIAAGLSGPVWAQTDPLDFGGGVPGMEDFHLD